MISLNNDEISKHIYSNVFIVENRNLWNFNVINCNKDTDLVLCLDFALKRELQNSGYHVEFLDHLTNNEILEKLNFEMHGFLNSWFKDQYGKDLLHYNGLDLGDSHLLLIINEVDYFCHFFFNIIALKQLKYQNLFVATNNEHIIKCINKMDLQYEIIEQPKQEPKPVYIFPILEWVSEKTQKPSFSYILKNTLANFFDFIFKITDPLTNKGKKYIYVHRYHPTLALVKELQKAKGIQLVYNNYSGLKDIRKERRIHYKPQKDNSGKVTALLANFTQNRYHTWYYEGYKISDYLYEIIYKVLSDKLNLTINAADSINDWFKKNRIDLMIPITNLWIENRLIMKYCQANDIPVFMIINGLLTFSFYNDAKDSDYVNCYSESIKAEYFNSAPNAIPLGDPRMDNYANISHKNINYINPTIVIGTAGYNPVDLNSYLAVEFDFLYDILLNIQELISEGKKIKVILKIRGNGYVHLYTSFVNEYFNGLDIEFAQDQSFNDVIKKADLYITIYSQTLFEASCMGIPVIYYKKDTQFVHKPFDGRSELVTASDAGELLQALQSFFELDKRFDLFKRKDIMEKYIGYLDGHNTKRNADYILNLVNS
ncbi:hypothetical protein [Mucilaginibacter sp.]|uniref:hypothetical protein n=1 Tax=Mucilaginibacter sp. TaxID=1882438 RepID=UPI0026286A63|nr:hypothetical protein [Mucilaginibacter sp.]MDB4921093.1 hypothetical protein [Mucilaginibacter sp.]